MDESCSSNTSESPPPLHLYRMSSANSSVILDIDNGIETESRKLPSSRFKGVVPQPNGRWGAQIYEKHQRVWLGTFNLQEDAASAYDIAARRFRGPDALTNFINPPPQPAESAFLEAHSKAEIVDMLRKHTYADEFEQSKRKFCAVNRNDVVVMNLNLKSREVLFEKTVTPSDVGKLNRLVIPKQYAEKHFPLPLTSNGVLINLEDLTGKVWRFRYSYWNSSQSYVLTKGWSRFVKEKNLRAGDVVTFQRSTGLDRQLFIDWKSRSDPVKVMVRLFGVDILTQNDVGTVCGGKRSRDVDLFASLGCSKKQAIINVL